MEEDAALGERVADEQGALSRQVAELVNGAACPDEVFTAVAAEAGRRLGVDLTILSRYEPEGTAAVMGSWARPGATNPLPSGTRLRYPDKSVHTLVFETRRPARIDGHGDETGQGATSTGQSGAGSRVGVPIVLEGSLWGQIGVASTQELLPVGTETWLVGFVELVTPAIANAQARMELRGYAEEQASLRRVAELVARPALPEQVFAAVAAEAGTLLGGDVALVGPFDLDGAATVVGGWVRTGVERPLPVGERLAPGGRNVMSMVFLTGRPARIDDYVDASGPAANAARGMGFRSAVGAPITVEGRLWGVITVACLRDEPLPATAEARLRAFSELLATAIAGVQARRELRGFAEEQSALRRVAVLVAWAARPEEVFAAVAEEIGRLLDLDFTIMGRYEPDGAAKVVGSWARSDPTLAPAVGNQTKAGGRNLHALVFQTGRSARIDNYASDGDTSGHAAHVARSAGVRSAVAAPIYVEDRLWGLVSAASVREESLPLDTEARLAGFTELVGTAIANAEARMELRDFADEQAALRRVAVLVARGVEPELVFAAVAKEVAALFGEDITAIVRFEPGGGVTVMGAQGVSHFEPGGRYSHYPRVALSAVRETGQATRFEPHDPTWAALPEEIRAEGIQSMVGAPIMVEGRLWGGIYVASRLRRLPPDTEARLAGFTDLAGTAVANADARTELNASRARIVAAADITRRRIERDLHDGAQQRLVSLGLQLRAAQVALPPEAVELNEQLDNVASRLTDVMEELREIARGIHPAVLAEGGLRRALRTLVRASAIPVQLDCPFEGRLPEQIELAAYYVVAEGLTNATKHADASLVTVEVAIAGDALRVCVSDDGRGGADATRGSGLVGLADRVQTLGGIIVLDSSPGKGTKLQIALPLGDLSGASSTT